MIALIVCKGKALNYSCHFLYMLLLSILEINQITQMNEYCFKEFIKGYKNQTKLQGG